MDKVLLNTANWMMLEHCKKHNIDCSNSYAKKVGRGYTYGLFDVDTDKLFLVSVFGRSTAPVITTVYGGVR